MRLPVFQTGEQIRARHRQRIDFAARRLVPPLFGADILGFEVFRVTLEVFHFELRPARGSGSLAITDALDDYAKIRAARLVSLHAPELYVLAGAAPVILPAAVAAPLVLRWCNWWKENCLNPVLDRSLAASPSDPREEVMVHLWSALMAKVLDPMEIRAGIRQGLRAAGKWKELRREASGDPDLEGSILSAEYFAAGPEKGRLYLNSDGEFRVGWRRIRDVNRRRRRTKTPNTGPGAPAESQAGGGESRVVKEHPVSQVDRRDDQEALIALDVLHRLRVADEAVEAAASVEAVDAVQAFVCESLQEKPTRVERLLLGRAWDLINETTTPTELARLAGHSERTVTAAWRRTLARMATHPRLRALLRSA